MFQQYFKYFLGAYQPVMDMQGMHKYDIHANVSAKFKGYNRYAIIVYCYGYFKYVQGL